MPAIVTYDIPSRHREMKKTMFDLGYKDQIQGSVCKVIYFPNTTLYHQTKTPEQARKDVESVCSRMGIELERCVATSWNNWSAICGEDFK